MPSHHDWPRASLSIPSRVRDKATRQTTPPCRPPPCSERQAFRRLCPASRYPALTYIGNLTRSMPRVRNSVSPTTAHLTFSTRTSSLSQGSVLLSPSPVALHDSTASTAIPCTSGVARTSQRAALAGLHLTSALSSSCLRRSRSKIWLLPYERLAPLVNASHAQRFYSSHQHSHPHANNASTLCQHQPHLIPISVLAGGDVALSPLQE